MPAGSDNRHQLPDYDELPVVDGRPAGSSWGLWGESDALGCLNLLTPERTVEAASLIRKGAAFALNWDMTLPDPPLFDRAKFTHSVNWLANEVGHDDELSGWNTQSSSQWDGFRHIKHPIHGFYNGLDDETHGIHHWAGRGLAGRAVLADVGRWREAQGRPLTMNASDPVEPDELLATLAAQGTEVVPGDLLLVRFGWVGWYRTLSATDREALAKDLSSPGLRPGQATARVLWNLHIAAVAADNPALEVWPPGSTATPEVLQAALADATKLPEIFVHFSLLPLLGLPIGEMWNLEELAEDCAADGVYELFFTSAPLNLPAGVASPPNAIAFK
ncbi:MAG TPA: cyclase family protein [Acidimicrobiales bacterium]|nr:cyclase family protein [Acidimicrobiales bacterium]